MSLTMHQRKAVIQELASRYQSRRSEGLLRRMPFRRNPFGSAKARKKDRSRMLEELGYNRAYAAFVLRNWGRKRILTINSVRTIYVFGPHRPVRRDKPTRRPRIYDHRILVHLKFLWALAGGLCGKRLAVFVRTTLPVLERFEELELLSISPATIDRLLAPVRKNLRLKGRSTTKPGTLLKHQIPIRTFAEWNERTPGGAFGAMTL